MRLVFTFDTLWFVHEWFVPCTCETAEKKRKKPNLLKEKHRAAQTTSAVHAKCQQRDGEAPPKPLPSLPPPWTLVRLLDGEQERQERRAEEDHAEGSANDMDVEWEMRDDQQASQTFEAGVDAGPLAVGGSTIFAWEQCCARSPALSLFHVQRAEHALENCLVCL